MPEPVPRETERRAYEMTVLSGVSDRIEAAPGVLEALDRGLTHPNQASDWRATVNGTRICSIDECDRRSHARNICVMHYNRLIRRGTTQAKKIPKTRQEYIAAFHERYDLDASGCWLWNRSTTAQGYGQWSVNGRHVTMHRWAFETFRGPIPDGFLVCHRCDTKRCVNPAHLELGTNSSNTQDAFDRGLTIPSNRRKTHCVRGHELPPQQVGDRARCAECRREYQGTPEYKAAQKARKARKWRLDHPKSA